MSRGGSCKQVLNEPSAAVISVKPSGDCFYECISLAMLSGGIDVRGFEEVKCAEDDDGPQALRRTAAEAVDAKMYAQFAMYHQAGLPDFKFMRQLENEHDLKAAILVSGKKKGCGQCLWANEFEIGACQICALAHTLWAGG